MKDHHADQNLAAQCHAALRPLAAAMRELADAYALFDRHATHAAHPRITTNLARVHRRYRRPRE